jgi:hypothetical protein
VAKAIIILEDVEGDQMNGSIEYVDGFSEESSAQQWGCLLMRQLSQWATPLGSEQIFGSAPSSRIDGEKS